MIVWTPAVWGVLCACVLYLHLFSAVEHIQMEKRSRNMLIIITIIVKCW